MAREKLLYIELKTGMADCGPAWIGRAKLSKTGRTIYFNDKALKFSKRGVGGNHYDIETDECYWVSGVKERYSNRHWAGRGIIHIDSRVVVEFLALRGISKLNRGAYKIVTIKDTDPSRFHTLENR